MSNYLRGASIPTVPGPTVGTRRELARHHRKSTLPMVAALALLLAGAAGLAGWPAEPSLVLAATVSSYGPGIGADSLANAQVGGSLCHCSNSSTSYRFRATQSSSLRSIMIYVIANGNTGYSHGTGGTMSITIQSDSGSSAHVPSGHVLATASLRPGNPGPSFPVITFSSPARLAAGQLYHVVFKNTDPSPTVNFVSVDSLWTGPVTTPRQPGLSDLDWGQLENYGRGWSTLRDYTPILDLAYTNGVHAGMGYMEVWVNAPHTISGSSAVREVFTPKASHTVSSVKVRVRQTGGSSPLVVHLETSGGSVLASGSISAASIGSTTTWYTARFSSSVALRKGSPYQLVLSAAAGTSYSAFSVERGNNYHFPSSEYFTDGYAQFTTGSGWRGFTDESGRTATNSDLQFIFASTGSAPRPAKPAPRPTARVATAPRPAVKAPASVAPAAVGSPAASMAVPSLDPTAPDAIALVPATGSASPPAHVISALATRTSSESGAVLPIAGLAVLVIGGLGAALRRRIRS
jgi:hypothetical protein